MSVVIGSSPYNNLVSVGRLKLQVDSLILLVSAAALLGLAHYRAFSRRHRRHNDGDQLLPRRAAAPGELASAAALALLGAVGLSALASGDGALSRVLAAASAVHVVVWWLS